METLSKEDLRQKLDEGEPPIVVEVLDPEDYRDFHLPSAINVPWDDDFKEHIQQSIGDKERDVVVYCRDRQCHASHYAAKAMEELGYTHVGHYPGGKAEWRAAGLPIDR